MMESNSSNVSLKQTLSVIFLDFKNNLDKSVYYFYTQNDLVISAIHHWASNPPKGYRIRVDKPHVPKSKKHIHIYSNGELVSINQDGTQHHHKGKFVPIPRRLYDWIKENFPDFPLPADRMIRLKNMHVPDPTISIVVDLFNRIIWI